MKERIKILLILIILGSVFFPSFSFSLRGNVFDWYIDKFETEIVVNKDSSLLITEKIIADCGNTPDKHGIFRVLPTRVKTTEGNIETPIKLISITDFNGRPLKYSTIIEKFNHTVTWKIGDPKQTVTCVNYYKIVYQVQNTIRFDNQDFDELYWNLNGNFWDLEIDNFTAKIIFPDEVNQQNSEVEYYTGFLGRKRKDLAEYRWLSDDVLRFSSIEMLEPGAGITVSVTFPKGIFTPYKPSLLEKYGNYLWFLIPLSVFGFCFKTWKKHGKDPKMDRTIIPEYEVPENLSPIETGMILTNGKFKKDLISAALINFAVKKNNYH